MTLETLKAYRDAVSQAGLDLSFHETICGMMTLWATRMVDVMQAAPVGFQGGVNALFTAVLNWGGYQWPLCLGICRAHPFFNLAILAVSTSSVLALNIPFYH